MSATNATTYYDLSQFVDGDKPTFLGNYNSDMLKIDNGIHEAATDAGIAVSAANAASSAASAASTSASAAVTAANVASQTATEASNTAGTALTNAGAALTAAQNAETKAKANDITNLAPDYDPTLTYAVGDLVTYVDENGTGKLYKCIVAIATPEAFNINKWDDVTTSEVFAKATNIISEATSDGTKTFSDLYNELMANYTPDPSINYSIKVIRNGISISTYNCHSVDIVNNSILFQSIGGLGSTGVIIDAFDIRSSGSTGYRYSITTTGTTVSDIGSNIASERTVQLLK